MPVTTPVRTETKTSVGLSQRVALLFVIGVGVLVVGSVLFAAVYTWTAKPETTTARANTNVSANANVNSAVLGVDHTFTTKAAPGN